MNKRKPPREFGEVCSVYWRYHDKGPIRVERKSSSGGSSVFESCEKYIEKLGKVKKILLAEEFDEGLNGIGHGEYRKIRSEVKRKFSLENLLTKIYENIKSNES